MAPREGGRADPFPSGPGVPPWGAGRASPEARDHESRRLEPVTLGERYSGAWKARQVGKKIDFAIGGAAKGSAAKKGGRKLKA